MVKVFRLSKTLVEDTIKRGRLTNFPLFGIKYIKNTENTTALAIVVSKKEAKLAVSRNKIKRRLREIFRPQLKNLEIQGYFVIFAKKEVLTQTNDVLNVSVKDALKTFEK